ncbi:hypothetical protein PY093_05705 [Cytobacillus sp. S13-E01]|uniref:YphA family membrane protein n=1 Tax=Cytobacillus sp. S13-E01 TaxID=3031326 RepID=UPI0023D83589|nr:hypothetical protein [Cytobacillus sp. S13-E01]MDF0726208.1 hypothetical protein [Cytobacillus sp. S13-E01]
MDGIYFYWIAWIIWTLSTFFMKKNNERLIITIIILMLIIFSATILQVATFKINASLLIALLSSYLFLSINTKNKTRRIVYILLCTLTITTAYVSFQLFELFDPIWLVFNRKIMLAFCLVYLTLLLVKDAKTRIICAVIGASQGEFLYAFILSDFRFDYEVGSLLFFDVLAISVFTLFIWGSLEDLVQYFDTYFQKTTKEKHG